jgi:hypothetical protein
MKKLLALISASTAYAVLVEVGLPLIIAAFIIWLWPNAPKPVVTQTTPQTITVQVPVDHIVTKDVIKYVEDMTNVKRLLAENAKLKIQVQQLSETIAKSHSTGGGNVVSVPVADVPEPLRPVNPASPTVFTFTDWRLHFVTDGQTAKYDLTQKFEVLSTTGRNAAGTPVNLVKLFELGPGDVRREITDTKTTTVVADDTRAHWHLSPTIIAGVAFTADVNGNKSPGGILGVRWLARGRTKSAEDSSLALLSPVVLLSGKTREVGLLPLSVNAGRLKHQPFRDLWLSPYVGLHAGTRTVGRFGVTLHASF